MFGHGCCHLRGAQLPWHGAYSAAVFSRSTPSHILAGHCTSQTVVYYGMYGILQTVQQLLVAEAQDAYTVRDGWKHAAGCGSAC